MLKSMISLIGTSEYTRNNVSLVELSFGYTISEVRGDDAGINYDTHEEPVTIVVTDDGTGTLTAATTYQNESAKFENETKPGTLTVTKQTDGNGDPDEEFTFEIRLTDDLGRSLDSVNIISDRQE